MKHVRHLCIISDIRFAISQRLVHGVAEALPTDLEVRCNNQWNKELGQDLQPPANTLYLVLRTLLLYNFATKSDQARERL